MSSIIQATWGDLGFAVVGDTGRPDTIELANRLEKYGGYKIQRDPDLTWAKLDPVPALLRLHGPITAQNYTDPELYRDLEKFYSQRELEHNIPIEAKGLAWAAEQFAKKDGYEGIYRVRQMLATLPLNQIERVLRDMIAPTFFKRYPEGRIWYVSKDERLEKLAAIVRLAGSLHPYGFAQALHAAQKRGTPETLRAAHTSGPAASDISLTILLSSFYPYIYGFVVPRVDSYFVVQIDTPEQFEPYYPVDLFDFVRPSSLYTEKRADSVGDLLQNKVQDEKLIHHRYVHKKLWSPAEFDALLRWWVDAQNALLTGLLDVCQYVDTAKRIEPFRALLTGLTWHRIQHLVAAVLTERDPFVRKSLFFQTLDQFGSLLSDESQGVKDTHVFDSMLRPSFYSKHVEGRLRGLPAPFGEYFADLGRQLYDDVADQTLAGVWDKSRLGTGTVTIPRWDKATNQYLDQPQTTEDFVAGLLKVFRNTLHGYRLNRHQFEEYLIPHNGNISDYLPDLATLYLVAGLGDPLELINRGWK